MRIIKILVFMFSVFLLNYARADVPVMVPEKDDPEEVIIPSSPITAVKAEAKSQPVTEDKLLDKEIKTIDIPMVQESFSEKDASKKAVKNVFYSKENIFKLLTREGMTSTIVLPSNEIITDIIVGNQANFTTEKVRDNIFMIAPLKINKDTSVTVLTNHNNVYPFYVKSISYTSNQIPNLVVKVKTGFFVDLNSSVNNSTMESSSTNLINPQVISNNSNDSFVDKAPLNPEKINWNYKMKGNKYIAPSRVWNDGFMTYLDFNRKNLNKDAVVVYQVKDSVDVPVNSYWEKNIMIVQKVGKLTLISGDRFTCIEPY